MSAYPAIGDCAVTAAAMRAAAAIIEESALAGLSVTCTSDQITVQVCEHAGDPAGRAAQVAVLAQIAGTLPYQRDSRTSAWTQVTACGQVRGTCPVVIAHRQPRPGETPRSGCIGFLVHSGLGHIVIML
jgi:hypothetical protein